MNRAHTTRKKSAHLRPFSRDICRKCVATCRRGAERFTVPYPRLTPGQRPLPLQPDGVRAQLGPTDGAARTLRRLVRRQLLIPARGGDAAAVEALGPVGDEPRRGRG